MDVMEKKIYIPGNDIWESIKEAAGEESVSNYLINLHMANISSQEVEIDRKQYGYKMKRNGTFERFNVISELAGTRSRTSSGT